MRALVLTLLVAGLPFGAAAAGVVEVADAARPVVRVSHDPQGAGADDAEPPPHVLPAVVTEAERPYARVDREGEPVPRWRFLLGRLHPLVVHFPIALLLTALLAELLALARRTALLDHAARFCILVGAVSAVVAAICGHAAADTVGVDRSLAALLERHELLGTVTAGLAVLAAIASEWSHRAAATARSLRAYRLILLALAVLVGVTGHYGGTLVFGTGHFG